MPTSPLAWAVARRRRGGFSWYLPMIGLAVVAAIALAAWLFRPETTSAEDESLVHTVKRGDFVYEIVEQGTVESEKPIELRCYVKSRTGSSPGTQILEILPEGTLVKANDVIVKFDSSVLENELTQQKIAVAAAQSNEKQGSNILDTARFALKEYVEGTYKQNEQTVQSEIFVAEENLRRAQEYLRYSQQLAAKGYVTTLQLEADRFAVEKARKELEAAHTKLEVLKNVTREKMVKQLEADILTAEARLQAFKDNHALEKSKLKQLEDQLELCVIRAPQPGQVVYAVKRDNRGNVEGVAIEEGAVIRERQPVVLLPNPQNMQVRAKINESRISRVRKGMPVTVRVDSMPGVDFNGVVTKVDEYPAPEGFMSSIVKQYYTYVRLDNPEGLRSGGTAEIHVHVEEVPNVVMVPVQAIEKLGGKFYCLRRGGSGWEPREVEIGITNDRFVIVNSGLDEGDDIHMNPRDRLREFNLPGAQDPSSLARQAPRAGAGGDRSTARRDKRKSEAAGVGGGR